MLTDADGIPLVVQIGPANQRDDGKLEDLLEAFPVLTDGLTQVVHVLPRVLLGDRGYGFPYLIALVVLYGIVSLVSPRGQDQPTAVAWASRVGWWSGP